MLVARRARLMEDMPAGAMLGVRASADAVTAELTPDVSIAAINAPKHTVVSGSHEAIAAFETRLEAKGVAHRRLHTSHAYHSPMMEPAVEPFAKIVAEIPRRAPELRWISSLTGRPITDDEAVDPHYWARQLREPVQFARGVGELLDAHIALVEVGPGQTLAALARQHDRRLPQQLITTSLHPGQDWSADIDYLLAAAGQLWARNVDIDWRRFHGDARRRRVPLPTYPFRRRRHWVDPIPQNDAVPAAVQPVLAATHPAATAPTSLPTQDTTVITSNRSAALLSRLQTVFADLSGVDPAILTPDATFLEIGFDSLFLTQAANALQKQFATKITVRTLLEDAPTLNLLVERILPTLPEDALPATTPVCRRHTGGGVRDAYRDARRRRLARRRRAAARDHLAPARNARRSSRCGGADDADGRSGTCARSGDAGADQRVDERSRARADGRRRAVPRRRSATRPVA